MKRNSTYILLLITLSAVFCACSRNKDFLPKGFTQLPSLIHTSNSDGIVNSYQLQYDMNQQIIGMTEMDSTKISFDYVGKQLARICKKDSGQTNAFVKAEFIYSGSELVKIISYVSSSPFEIDISYDALSKLYTARTNTGLYQFQYDAEGNLLYHNSAIMERATIIHGKEQNGIFNKVSIPMALSIYYAFYDASTSFLFFNKKTIETVRYNELGQVRKYSYKKDGDDLLNEIEIQGDQGYYEKLTIEYNAH